MMRLIDRNSTLQSNLACHADTMKIDRSTFHLERQHLSDKCPLTPIAESDCHAMSIDDAMTISPMSNTAIQRRVRFTLPTSDVQDFTKLRNIFDDVDCMIIADDDRDVTEPSAGDAVGPSDMYWDRSDMKKNRLYAQRKAIIIRHKYPQEVEALESVIIDCCQNSEAMRPQQMHSSKGNLFTIIQTEVTTMHNWSSSYVRGLEDYMTPLLSEKRCNVIQHVIRYQSFLQAQQQSPADVTNHLCEYSRKLSQPSRDFALKLAIGDALAASCDL
jgi:hypothetical protein